MHEPVRVGSQFGGQVAGGAVDDLDQIIRSAAPATPAGPVKGSFPLRPSLTGQQGGQRSLSDLEGLSLAARCNGLTSLGLLASVDANLQAVDHCERHTLPRLQTLGAGA